MSAVVRVDNPDLLAQLRDLPRALADPRVEWETTMAAPPGTGWLVTDEGGRISLRHDVVAPSPPVSPVTGSLRVTALTVAGLISQVLDDTRLEAVVLDLDGTHLEVPTLRPTSRQA